MINYSPVPGSAGCDAGTGLRDQADVERLFMCRQLALSQACHDHKGSYPISETIALAAIYEDYLYGGIERANALRPDRGLVVDTAPKAGQQ